MRRTWYLTAPDKKTFSDWIQVLQEEVSKLIKRDSFALGNSLDLKKSIRKATASESARNLGEDSNLSQSGKSKTLNSPLHANLVRTKSSALNSKAITLSTKPKEKHIFNICTKMKSELEIKDRTWRFQEYKHCFVGKN